MRIRKSVLRRWRELSINTKFTAAFGVLLTLIVLVGINSYVALTIVNRQTKAVIPTSTEIQRLVLEMDKGLEKARRLQRDFLLQYPEIGFSQARDTFALQAIQQTDQVVILGAELKERVAQSNVSAALQERDVDLNLYLSLAERYADTILETVQLINALADEQTGLRPQLDQLSSSLYDNLATHDPALIVQYRAMQAFEKDYLLTHQRPFLHAAFYESLDLRAAIEESPALQAGQGAREQALACLDDYLTTTEEIAELNVAISGKFHDFDLQAESVDPISAQLLTLAKLEVTRARAQIERASQFTTDVIVVTVVAGLALVLLIAQVLNQSITRNVIKLTRAAGELQQGNLDASAQIESADELGQLADTFNAMAAELKAKMVELTELNQSLQISERKYRKLFEDSLDMIAITTPDGKLADVNAAGVRLFGYSRVEELMAQNTKTLYAHPEDRARFRQGLVQDGSIRNFETQFRRADGSIVDVILNATVQRAEDGTTTGFQTIVHDITNRKRMEEALREEKAFTETALDAQIDTFFVFDPTDGRPMRWNKVFETVSGYSAQEIQSMVPFDYYPADEHDRIVIATQEALSQGRTTVELSLITKDDQIIPYEYIGSLIKDHKGNPSGICVVGRDITQRKRAEEELRQYREQLEELVQARTAELVVAKEQAEAANQTKSAFLANMSHELRTPLNAILGFTQLMRRDLSFRPDQRKNLRIIHQSGEHLLGLLNDVLEMSKIEAGRAAFIESDLDLHTLLANLESMFGARAQGKGLQLGFECAPDVPQYIRTDERKLRQTLINLLDNAVKFTEQGSVTLRVWSEDEGRGSTDERRRTRDESSRKAVGRRSSLVFEVQDTGAGIAPEEMGQLFEAFTQTASGQKSLQGTGLGLALSRRFVQLMGGDITVQSPPPTGGSEGGGGSVFRFDIQVTVADIGAVQERRPARRVVGLAPGQPAYRVLVVEDREASRALLVQLLTTVGLEVREVVNGQEAIEVWQAWNPHLIWMDVRMPVMDGYEATRRIKSQISNIQYPIIIALTAHAFEEERAAILAAGCDDFVCKPFKEKEIFDKMAEHLDVRYIYEDLDPFEEQDVARQAQAALKPDDLAALPPSWVADLRQAARVGEAEQILELVEQIETKEHTLLVEALMQLVHEFRFDKIVALTQSDKSISL